MGLTYDVVCPHVLVVWLTNDPGGRLMAAQHGPFFQNWYKYSYAYLITMRE